MLLFYARVIEGSRIGAGYSSLSDYFLQRRHSEVHSVTIGCLSIVDRSKDLVITGDYNFYPGKLEFVIDEIDGANESALIGFPEADFGEKMTAVIVKKEGSSLNSDDVLAVVASEGARFKQPRNIFSVSQPPRNEMGKIQNNSLRETFRDS